MAEEKLRGEQEAQERKEQKRREQQRQVSKVHTSYLSPAPPAVLVSKKYKLVCFGVEIMNFVFFGVKKSVFLVSVENGAGVKK